MGEISPSNSTAVYQLATKYSGNCTRARCEDDNISPKGVNSCMENTGLTIQKVILSGG